jgi:spore coat protein U-like protein
MRHFLRRGLLAAALLAAPSLAFAAQSTTNMNVSMTVTTACTISVTDINFGAVPASALISSLTSSASMGGLFTYACGASTTTPALAASVGQNHTTSNRMKGSLGGFIPYSLNIPAVAAFSGAVQTAQITATIPAQGTLPAADTYTDAVVLTLTY